MWTFEHSEEGEGTREAVWALWSDVAGWRAWDDGVVESSIDGPFVAGSSGTLTPAGQEPVAFTIIDARTNEGFVDQTEVPGAVLRFEHVVDDAAPSRVRVTHRVVIDGPAAEQIGAAMAPMLAAGLPEAVARLVALAGERAAAR